MDTSTMDITKMLCYSLVILACLFCITEAFPAKMEGHIRQKRHQHSGHETDHSSSSGGDIHGGVKMGVVDNSCDNALMRLEIDWDNSTDYEYKCQPTEQPISTKGDPATSKECLHEKDIPMPYHVCMDEVIEYTDMPPRGGPHRPLWPVFGEYVYLPPQRWVHSLEHGAAVFLYHPCADKAQINLLKQNARQCLRKHVITPYRHLPADKPFAVLTWGCRLMMNEVQEGAIHHFVMTHAMKTYESKVTKDGQFSWGLIKQAQIVSDLKDSELCPNNVRLIEEEMFQH